MHTDDEVPPKKKSDKSHASTDTLVCVEKVETPKKVDKSGAEEPKPRIVLTIRSEKSSAKSTNMKIVSPEEKQEEVSPRRSSRTKGKWEWICDGESVPSASPRTDENISQSETESDNSYTPPRLRRRGAKDDVIASAIARKEKSYNEATPTPTQRLSRRIKPTAKILANEELRIGLESQNNARLGINTEKSPEEGVRTRRSARPANTDGKQDDQEPEVLEIDDDSQGSGSQVMKLKHLCELGLKAINPETEAETPDGDDSQIDTKEDQDTNDDDDEEVDDDSEVISKLLEADDQGTSDEDFFCAVEASRRETRRPRRSSRFYSAYGGDEGDRISPPAEEEKLPGHMPTRRIARRNQTNVQDRSKRRKNRSCDKEEAQSEVDQEESSNTVGGEEGSEPACPPEEATVVATCSCEKPSNVYAAPDELTEPVFCQAIEMVDGVRVGCSHGARREGCATGSKECGALGPKERGALGPLVRAGPRTPHFLACALHAAQLAKHMCCPACGLFCTQGVFYQCSAGHLFHLECGLPYQEGKPQPGCPHCGVLSPHWQPANRRVSRVRVALHCSNRRVFLPDQREQCTPAYLGFAPVDPSKVEQEPIIPDDILPPLPSNLKQLMQKAKEANGEVTAQDVCDAILAGASLDELITKIASGAKLDTPLSSQGGGTCVHVASGRGGLAALHLLHQAHANMDVADCAMRTPLMRTVLALLDKPVNKKKRKLKENAKETEDMETDETKEDEKTEGEDITVEEKTESDVDGVKDEDLMKVIKYLVIVGCDVNTADGEGLTALHMAAQHGSAEVCGVLLAAPGARCDPRDHGGWTPLVWAAENKHAQVVKMLLEHGADACAADGEGNQAVHWAALAGAAQPLQLLLHHAPAAKAATNTHTDTPLHIAARQGHYTCVLALLARGVKTDVENSAGEVPLDVCSGACHDAISLNMQMTLALGDKITRKRLLTHDISNGRELFPIPCINEVDDTPLPDDFTYVIENVTPTHIHIDTTIECIQGCACSGGNCSGSACTCGVLSVQCWAVSGQLMSAFPHHDAPMIFECNATCACNAKLCTNRGISKLESTGSMGARVSVVRTAGRGWGLRSDERVSKGQAVALYRGELIPLDDADTRARDFYMFGLNLNPDLLEQCTEKTQLCIDAAQYGSAARFVNHSCRPNLSPVRVFTKTRDLRLPTVTLFALRDINAGEELTFDYGDKFWAVKSKWMKCECGSVDCRFPEKTTEEAE